MQSDNLLKINLAQAVQTQKRLHIELNTDFFADLEQEEIIGGEIHVDVLVHSPISDLYNLNIKVEGNVEVQCDRCLDSLKIDVNAEDTIKVKDADFSDSDAEDIHYCDGPHSVYDISWDVYEIIETSLPMQRVHPQGQCNKQMLSFIIGNDDDLDSDAE